MNNKEKAAEIYAKHIAIASTDGKGFRRTVMDEIMVVCQCSLAASATYYNNVKNASAPIEGLGRPASTKTARKSAGKDKESMQDDNECYTVIELLKHKDKVSVGRCKSHLLQGDASEEFDERVQYNPVNSWVMIKGLGPLHNEVYKLQDGEVEIKRYTPTVEKIVEFVDLVALEQDEVAVKEEVAV